MVSGNGLNCSEQKTLAKAAYWRNSMQVNSYTENQLGKVLTVLLAGISIAPR
jgi:hypothetical protein